MSSYSLGITVERLREQILLIRISGILPIWYISIIVILAD